MSDTKQQHRVYQQTSIISNSAAGVVPSSLEFDMDMNIPIEELVKSLMSCGDKIRHEIYNMNANAGHYTSYHSKIPLCSPMHSEEESTASESGCSSYPGEGAYSYPRFDSPYKEKGKWPKSQATYFLRSKSSTSHPFSHRLGSGRTLSANAPIFTPLSDMGNLSSPGSVSADLWELPGLPSPMLEFTEAPSFDSRDICNNHISKDAGASLSILQRGFSSLALGGKYLHL